MVDYKIIIADLVIFTLIILIAYYLSNLFPGKVKESLANKGRVAHLHIQTLKRRLMQCIYIVGVSLLLDLVFIGLKALSSLPEPLPALFSLEQKHFDGWVVFWVAAAILYFIEYQLRSYYLRQNKTSPIAPLLFIVLRFVVLIGVTLWIAKYVLNWHGTHILISSTALLAIAGFALKGTLGDFLAGISLHMSHAVTTSQWISLPRLAIEGEVIVANWRETRLRTTSGHVHIIPNSQLARQNFHNMSWPDSRRRHNLDFILSPDNDPAMVEAALLAAALASDQVTQTPKPPVVVIKAYLEFGINYQLRVWSDTFHDPSSLENAIYRKAWAEFNQRGIRFMRLSGDLMLKRQLPP